MNKKIAFDLDGVVYDFVNPFDDFVRSKGYSIIESEYDRGLDLKVKIKLLDEFGLTRPFKFIPLCKKAKEEMIRLAEHNEIYIITYRDWTEYGIEDTLERISKDGLPVKPENIIFSSDKGFQANKLGIDIFYEDLLKNATDILKNSNSLVRLIDAPYNQSSDVNLERIKW